MIISQDRYEAEEIVKSMFEVKMILTIRSLRKEDAGRYHCMAKNSLGDVDSVVKLQGASHFAVPLYFLSYIC